MNLRTTAILAAGAVALTALGAAGGFTAAQAAQPHMQTALADLQAAKAELQQAVPDKGGHRVNALRLTNQAIGETQAGIGFAATH
jgi:outer membrane lipoprotein-sorting protein